jgi:hypothetical protein
MCKFRYPRFTLTQLGELYGVTNQQVGKWLASAGLRDDRGKPTRLAHDGGYCEQAPSRNDMYVWAWRPERVVPVLEKLGHRMLSMPPVDLVEPPPLAGPFGDVHLYLRSWVERLDLDWRSLLPTAAVCGLEDCLPMAEMIRDRDWYFSACEYGRVHHNVSSLQSEFRRFLSYNGQGLINLDIANSQPLIFSVVLINSLVHKDYLCSLYSWEIDNSGFYFELPTSLFLQEENTTLHTSPAHPLRLPALITAVEETTSWKDTTRRLLAHGLPQDALLYVELTQRGLLYEYLMQQEGVPQDKRAEFKKSFFGGVFFCKNRPVTKQARLFQAHFPSVYDVIFDLKANDYRRLAHVLQRTESSLIINRIARRCMAELPGVCVVTIHDSVLTTPDGVEPVRRIMAQEFRRVGLDPTIRVEDHSSAAG